MVQINKMLRNPKMNSKPVLCKPQQGRTVGCGKEGGGGKWNINGKRAEISFSLLSSRDTAIQTSMGGAGGDALDAGNYNHAHAHAKPTWTRLSFSKLTVKANLL